MAENKSGTMDMEAHREFYAAFVRGAVALTLASAFVCVALCMFAFGKSLTFLIGFGGIIAGLIAVTIDAFNVNTKWILSLGLLVLYGLLVAFMVT